LGLADRRLGYGCISKSLWFTGKIVAGDHRSIPKKHGPFFSECRPVGFGRKATLPPYSNGTESGSDAVVKTMRSPQAVSRLVRCHTTVIRTMVG
jgi:hypothetical protein